MTQKGSLVAPDRLRFDFSHPRPLTQEDIRAIEAEVNERIRANSAVRTRLLTPDRAVADGALALFGEKYGDEVRVVAMGGANDDEPPFSVELCGGTHVGRTGDIGLFKIIGEMAIASGVRRIEALTGDQRGVFDDFHDHACPLGLSGPLASENPVNRSESGGARGTRRRPASGGPRPPSRNLR